MKYIDEANLKKELMVTGDRILVISKDNEPKLVPVQLITLPAIQIQVKDENNDTVSNVDLHGKYKLHLVFEYLKLPKDLREHIEYKLHIPINFNYTLGKFYVDETYLKQAYGEELTSINPSSSIKTIVDLDPNVSIERNSKEIVITYKLDKENTHFELTSNIEFTANKAFIFNKGMEQTSNYPLTLTDLFDLGINANVYNYNYSYPVDIKASELFTFDGENTNKLNLNTDKFKEILTNIYQGVTPYKIKGTQELNRYNIGGIEIYNADNESDSMLIAFDSYSLNSNVLTKNDYWNAQSIRFNDGENSIEIDEGTKVKFRYIPADEWKTKGNITVSIVNDHLGE